MTVTIRNPENDAHFMHVNPVRQRVRVMRGGRVLADTRQALRVMETGRGVYDPVVYIPSGDVNGGLAPLPGKSTHCPLKGDASYFALDGDEVAWTYDRPLEAAELLRDHVAFYADRVTIEEIGERG